MAVALSESNKVDGPSLVDPVGLDLSVIVPCFNECNTVEVLLRRVRQALPMALFVLFATLWMLAGCSPAIVALEKKTEGGFSSSELNSIDNPYRIRAGVVFVHESSYYCIPLDELGIGEDGVIKSVHASCECVVPAIVKYADGNGRAYRALKVSFPGLEPDKSKLSEWSNMAVEIRIYLADAIVVTVVEFRYVA